MTIEDIERLVALMGKTTDKEVITMLKQLLACEVARQQSPKPVQVDPWCPIYVR